MYVCMYVMYVHYICICIYYPRRILGGEFALLMYGERKEGTREVKSKELSAQCAALHTSTAAWCGVLC